MTDDGANGQPDVVSSDEAGSGAVLNPDSRGWGVVAGDGTWLGAVADVLVDRASGEPRYLAVALEPSLARRPGGRLAYVPAGDARMDEEARRVHLDGVEGVLAHLLPDRPGGEHGAPINPVPLPDAAPVAADEVRMQVSEEELQIAKRTVDAGEVRVHKSVQTERVREVVPVMREDVTVERRPLPDGAALEPRQEGDTWFIPVVEEELVIQKRLVAREELVIRKRQVMGEQVVEETIRRETPEVLGPGDEPRTEDAPPA